MHIFEGIVLLNFLLVATNAILNLTDSIRNCEVDWTLINDKCYRLFSDKPRDNFEAQLVCMQNGGQLASIHSMTAQLKLLKLGGMSPAWIGARR